MTKEKTEFIPLHDFLMFKYIFGTKDNLRFTIDFFKAFFNVDSTTMFEDFKLVDEVALNKKTINSENFNLSVKLDAGGETMVVMFPYIRPELKSILILGLFPMDLLNEVESKYANLDDNDVVRKCVLANTKDITDLYIENHRIYFVDYEKECNIYFNNSERFEKWRKLIGAKSLEEAEKIADEPIFKDVIEEMKKFSTKDYVKEYIKNN